MSEWGATFARAIAERDPDLMRRNLSPEVDFKGLTPRRLWEASTPDEVVEVVLGHWFEEQDHITAARIGAASMVADTHHLGYGFDLDLPDGPHVVEQQVYYRSREHGIEYMRIVCSGFRPVGRP